MIGNDIYFQQGETNCDPIEGDGDVLLLTLDECEKYCVEDPSLDVSGHIFKDRDSKAK